MGGLYQPDIALGNQVGERKPIATISMRDAHDQSQMTGEKFVQGPAVGILAPAPRRHALLLCFEQRKSSYLPQVAADVGRGISVEHYVDPLRVTQELPPRSMLAKHARAVCRLRRYIVPLVACCDAHDRQASIFSCEAATHLIHATLNWREERLPLIDRRRSASPLRKP